MMDWIEKANKVYEKEFQLLRSEIQKVNSFATKENGKKTEITGYGYGRPDELGFLQVKCEMCSEDMTVRENDVMLEICLFDRRRSWAHRCI